MKKIPTLFVRDFDHDNGRYVTREVTPGCEWVLAGEGVATRKWDGTCVKIADDGSLWARREVKAGKSAPDLYQLIEADPVTGKTVGWEPAERSSFAKYITEAIDHATDLPPGTYELVGPKVNGNPDEFDTHRLVRHGRESLALFDRSYEGINDFLRRFHHMEGIVFWRDEFNPAADMAKIKRRDFPE